MPIHLGTLQGHGCSLIPTCLPNLISTTLPSSFSSPSISRKSSDNFPVLIPSHCLLPELFTWLTSWILQTSGSIPPVQWGPSSTTPPHVDWSLNPPLCTLFESNRTECNFEIITYICEAVYYPFLLWWQNHINFTHPSYAESRTVPGKPWYQ